MSDEHLAELMLIDFSRAQREVLERWMRICVDAGEPGTAEEVRRAISVQDAMEVRHAA